MKKLMPVAAIAVFALMFTSCKKDYTCTCTYSGPSVGVTVSDQKFTISKTTKKDAESKCSGYTSTVSFAGTSTGWNCHL